MKMVREFVEQAESKGYQSMTKEAGKYAKEYGLQLQLNQYDKFTIRLRNRVNFKRASLKLTTYFRNLNHLVLWRYPVAKTKRVSNR